MRVIALSLALAALSFADTHRDVMHVFGNMASALTAGNPDQFMESFDRGMPDYDTIKDDVIQLVGEGQITSIAEPIHDEGDDRHRTVDLDWTLDIQIPDSPMAPQHRRETVHCRLEVIKGHWRVYSLDPISFFAPRNSDSK